MKLRISYCTVIVAILIKKHSQFIYSSIIDISTKKNYSNNQKYLPKNNYFPQYKI